MANDPEPTISQRPCMNCEKKLAPVGDFFCSRACLKKYNEKKWNVR